MKKSFLYYYEKYWPYFYSGLLLLLIHNYDGDFLNFNKLVLLIKTNSISVAATLLGFFLTIYTIIHAIDTPAMRYIKVTGNFDRVLKYLQWSIRFNGFSIVASILIDSLNAEAFGKSINSLLCYTFLFIALTAVFTSIRFTLLFIKIAGYTEPPATTS